LPYLKKRSKDALFVAASGVLHGGPVNYDVQQDYVERIVDIGNPIKFTDTSRNLKFLTDGLLPDDATHQRPLGRTSQLRLGMSVRLAKTMDRYIEHCGNDGNKCKTRKGQDAFMESLREVKGFKVARKIRAMMREYWGDKDAIAVDRHVANWACNDAKLVCARNMRTGKKKDWKQGDHIPEHFFNAVADSVRGEASKCEITPATLQVGAWMHGACKSRTGGSAGISGEAFGNKLSLGRGNIIDCSRLPHASMDRTPKEIPV
jgi:hypothetical protein